METVDDLYVEDVNWRGKKYWDLKDEVFSFPPVELVSGDRVFFKYKKSTYRYEDFEEFLQHVGCQRVKKLVLANKIVNCRYWSPSLDYKPESIPDEVRDRFKTVVFDNFEEDLKKFKDNQRERFEFDYSRYTSIWNLLTLGDKDNVKLACIGIMSMNWKDREFLLRFLEINFTFQFSTSLLGQLPGWSLYASTNNFNWKSFITDKNDVIDLIKEYKPLPEEIELIHKLLNQ